MAECIRALVAEEPFAVLCTQGEGQPYGSVVAFAFDHDLKSFVFATPRATRKFRLLSQCDRVALVVDNRGKYPRGSDEGRGCHHHGQGATVGAGPRV